MEFFAATTAIIILVWLIVLTYYVMSSLSRYNKIFKGAKGNGLVETLTRDVHHRLEEINQKLPTVTQKVTVKRFNPFSDTGGDQSFVLTILDANDTGVVLTSLHSRGTTRWYAKNVRHGKGVDFDLSDEELQAIKQAVASKTKK